GQTMMMSPALLGAFHSAMIAGAAACPLGLACGWGNYCRAGATVVPSRQVGRLDIGLLSAFLVTDALSFIVGERLAQVNRRRRRCRGRQRLRLTAISIPRRMRRGRQAAQRILRLVQGRRVPTVPNTDDETSLAPVRRRAAFVAQPHGAP